jgi:hypothetical protein
MAVSSYFQLAPHSPFLILAHYLPFRSNIPCYDPPLRWFRRVSLQRKLERTISPPLFQLSLASCGIELNCENINFVHIKVGRCGRRRHADVCTCCVMCSFHPITCHASTSARLMGVGDQRHAPASLPQERAPVPIVEKGGWF